MAASTLINSKNLCQIFLEITKDLSQKKIQLIFQRIVVNCSSKGCCHRDVSLRTREKVGPENFP
jgi:hypothetical protein